MTVGASGLNYNDVIVQLYNLDRMHPRHCPRSAPSISRILGSNFIGESTAHTDGQMQVFHFSGTKIIRKFIQCFQINFDVVFFISGPHVSNPSLSGRQPSSLNVNQRRREPNLSRSPVKARQEQWQQKQVTTPLNITLKRSKVPLTTGSPSAGFPFGLEKWEGIDSTC